MSGAETRLNQPRHRNTSTSLLYRVECAVDRVVYYNAIRRASSSRVLQAICKQILADEAPHIRFQCERLAILHRARAPWLLAITRLAHLLLFTLITLSVWVAHRRALRAGGYPFFHFWRTAWSRMRRGWKIMAPSAYRWPTAAETESPGISSNQAEMHCGAGTAAILNRQ